MSNKTLQNIVYTLIGVTIMVPIMSIYNKFLVYADFMEFPLTTPAFWKAVGIGICQRYPVVFPLQYFIVQKFAAKQTALHTRPEDDWIYQSLIRTSFSILILCPALSLYANLLLVLDGTLPSFPAFLNNWLPKMVVNWPFAYFVQLFFAGPLNRAIFLALLRAGKTGSVKHASF